MENFIYYEPGMLCNKGCCYMACRGLTLAKIMDLLVISHGPIGCAYFSWQNDTKHSFSTNMSEEDIIFGGEEKLIKAIDEAVNNFNPKAIAVCSTCAIGLIGDDVERVCKDAQNKYNIDVIPFTCEGFKDIPGFMLASKKLVDDYYGTCEKEVSDYSINLVGEFFNDENREEIGEMLRKIGYTIESTLFNPCNFEDIKAAPSTKLVLQGSTKPIKDFEVSIKNKFNMDTLIVNFYGTKNITNSLLNIANYFNDSKLLLKTLEYINKSKKLIADNLSKYKKQFKEYSAIVYNDGFKGKEYYEMLNDLEIDVELLKPKNSDSETNMIFINENNEIIKAHLFNNLDHKIQYAGYNGLINFAKDIEMEVFMYKWEKGLIINERLLKYEKRSVVY